MNDPNWPYRLESEVVQKANYKDCNCVIFPSGAVLARIKIKPGTKLRASYNQREPCHKHVEEPCEHDPHQEMEAVNLPTGEPARVPVGVGPDQAMEAANIIVDEPAGELVGESAGDCYE